MTTSAPTSRKPLRLWPGVAGGALVLAGLALPVVVPGIGLFAMLGAAVGTLTVIVWWVLFSRAPWSERVGAVVLMIIALFATRLIVHESIRGGMMGRMPYVFGTMVLSFALAAGALAGRRLAAGPRRAAMVGTILLGCTVMALVRTGGISGAGEADLHLRWTKTPEERLLAQVREALLDAPRAPAAGPGTPPETKPLEKAPVAPVADTPAAVAATPHASAPTNDAVTSAAVERRAEWPGFRGPNRDGVVKGVRINTDWAATPPAELWRRPIGPGWSSFAVRGDLVYTQEQRGEDELVSAYRLTTGEPVWRHRDGVRFYESNGGPGPRATPALSGDRVYTLGATGILNALNADTGAVLWSRNAVTDGGVKVPGWGIAGSPLVVGNLVVVAASGALVAYDRTTGDRRWLVKSTGGSYSSPHLVTIDGRAQILLIGGAGVTSVAPTDGTVLWRNEWDGSPIVQPALTADGDVLITTADMMGGLGTRRLAVTRGSGEWKVEERWTSRGLKPYFNDFVVHKGHAIGFDGSILACIDLADGQRKWKGGRYGNGQIVLVADQDLLLVLSEEGELALVSATPDKFTELAKVKAIEGKTWNHPVLVGDVLLVRNGEEMAAFRIRRVEPHTQE